MGHAVPVAAARATPVEGVAPGALPIGVPHWGQNCTPLLINAPQLVLADEPTGALDSESAASLSELLCELNRKHEVTLLAVTHSEYLASRMGRVLELRAGRLTERSGRTGEATG